MKLMLHEYKFDNNFSVLEIKNDGRRIGKDGILIPKYEYHLVMRREGLEKDEFIFGCDCIMMASGYFNPFIKKMLQEVK